MTRRFLVTTILLAPALSAQETWRIDPSHSASQFAVRHMMVSTVRGGFGQTTGTVVWNEADPTKSSVDVTIDAKTINTRNEKRDAHLRSADFFEVDKYPTITFKSAKVEGKPGALKLIGDLTMHGVTKPVTFDVEGPTPAVKAGNTMRMGAVATARINRSDWGLTWNRAIEAGGVTVSEEVAITIDIQLTRNIPGGS